MLKNSTTRYGTVSTFLHWGMALLVVGMLCVGLYMHDVEALTLKLRLYNLHKSFGIVVLALAFLRVVWHLFSSRPPLEGGLARFEKLAARGMHTLLYVFLFLMPLSGWLMSSAGGRPVKFFGLFTLPDMIARNPASGKILHEVHEISAYALIALIALHLAAALKHHFINKDATLRRMLPFFKNEVKE